jgi:endonuclease/exonuclease/phosphatase family metal-dependent hydrolase
MSCYSRVLAIVCFFIFSEVDEEVIKEWLQPLADRMGGMQVLYIKKVSEDNRDGSALLIDRQRWSVRSQEAMMLGASGTSQVALLARLESVPQHPESKPSSLLVVSTHLKSKPGHEERRRDQVRVLLHAIQREQLFVAINDMPSDQMTDSNQVPCPCLVLGDFNDVPDSLACQAMRAAGFTSAYDKYPGETFYTTAKKREQVVCRTIDYMWCSPTLVPRIVSLLQVPPISAFPHFLPCTSYPSDHLALGVELAI